MSFVYNYEYKITSASFAERISSITGSGGSPTGSFTGSFTGSLQGTASYALQSENSNTIDVNSFGSNVESYLLMSNVIATPGVGIGGDSDLRYNASTNRLTVGTIEATSFTGSLQGTASYANNALSSSYALSASFAPSTPPFPFTGSARITGSLGVTGSVRISNGLIISSSINIKGDSDTVGNVFTAENLSNTNGLTVANTGLITARTSGGGSNYNLMLLQRDSNTLISFNSSGGQLGIAIGTGTSIRISNTKLLIQGTATAAGADNEAITFNNLATSGFIGGDMYAFRNTQVIYGFGSSPSYSSILRVYNSVSASSGNNGQSIAFISNTPTINQTAGTVNMIGYDYNPTITAITGAHYGILVRPSGTFNGIGLRSTLPSASLHIRGGLTGSVFLLESNISASIFTVNNNGSSSFNGSLTVGNITSTPSTENTLNIYPPSAGGTGEGGQILLAASGGLYTSASMLDTWQNQFRLLKGTNTAGSTAGLVYVDLQSGNTQFVGAVTASAYSGLPNDYLYTTRNTNQTIGSGTWANRDVVFNNLAVTKGIAYNTGTGLASLTGGRVYRITARLAWSAAAPYLLQYSCYTSADTQIGPTVEIVQSTNASNNISDGTLDFIYAPGSNTDVKIRTTNNTSALSGEFIRGDLNTQLIIQQIA
jgi:hypothetical protein